MKNATPMRWLFILSFFPAFAFSQQPVFQFKLQLMPDGESWGVYLMPAIALPSNQQFILGTAQV
nr:hypothetical protein [Saprospiraceae bacterium]